MATWPLRHPVLPSGGWPVQSQLLMSKTRRIRRRQIGIPNQSLIDQERSRSVGYRELAKVLSFLRPLLTRYLKRLGLEENTANDVIQDVFVRLLQALPTFELDNKRGRFRSYLWKLTYSALVDQARRVKVRATPRKNGSNASMRQAMPRAERSRKS